MTEKVVGEAITFDDVLLLPRYSTVVPSEVDTATPLTRGILLNIPVLSSAMDTVTESAMAIALAQEGGLGVIHKNLPLEQQVREVARVKRFEAAVIEQPITLPPEETVGTARRIMKESGISGIPVVRGDRLVGIITSRDLRFHSEEGKCIEEVMTKDRLVTAKVGTKAEEVRKILNETKVEKLLLVDDQFHLRGLVTMKDLNNRQQHPRACKDAHGRLRVGAAIGAHEYDRAAALVDKEVDLLVVDTAHGHSKNVIETVRELKKRGSTAVMAGNVATRDGAQALIDAGADALKVGIGPGSICTTRVIAGIGVPQITAIMEAAKAAAKTKTPIVADGGIRHSGDITKAIAAGASAVMVGGLLAGCAESPGEAIIHKGRSYKTYRGMGSLGAMVSGGKERYGQKDVTEREKLVPEGVEGMVPFKGPVSDFLYQLVGGLRAGMGYCGAETVSDLQRHAQFIRISTASLRENHPHDILITKEAPNYSGE